MEKTRLRQGGDRGKKIRFPWTMTLHLQENCALTPNMEEDKIATVIYYLDQQMHNTPCPKKIVPIFNIFFLSAQCVESGVSCTDCY